MNLAVTWSTMALQPPGAEVGKETRGGPSVRKVVPRGRQVVANMPRPSLASCS